MAVSAQVFSLVRAHGDAPPFDVTRLHHKDIADDGSDLGQRMWYVGLDPFCGTTKWKSDAFLHAKNKRRATKGTVEEQLAILGSSRSAAKRCKDEVVDSVSVADQFSENIRTKQKIHRKNNMKNHPIIYWGKWQLVCFAGFLMMISPFLSFFFWWPNLV